MTLIKEFLDSICKEEDKDNIQYINVTGYGFDIYQEEVTKFISNFLKKFEFRKEKHIKAITHGLLSCKNISNQSLFYNFTPLDIVKLPKIDFSNFHVYSYKKQSLNS